MKKKIKKLLLVVFVIIFLVILYYYPFPIDKECSLLPLCRVKFGVYAYDSYSYSIEKSYFGTGIHFHEKVGGFWEYLGLKDIECN
jgi:hypothetical protein